MKPLVRPHGTVASLSAPATWAMVELATMRFELRDLNSRPGS